MVEVTYVFHWISTFSNRKQQKKDVNQLCKRVNTYIMYSCL
jgi:hypothetical protein